MLGIQELEAVGGEVDGKYYIMVDGMVNNG
jgi:hypothetical protein